MYLPTDGDSRIETGGTAFWVQCHFQCSILIPFHPFIPGADPGFLPGEGAKGMMTLYHIWDGNERFLTYANTDL